MKKTITITFTRFYRDITTAMKNKSGVYMVYAYNKESGEVTRLLYIGESKNIYDRLSDETHQLDWTGYLKGSEEACYTYAIVSDEDRVRAQDAMIYHEKPICNTMSTESFNHDDTEIIIKCKSNLGPKAKSYTVCRTD